MSNYSKEEALKIMKEKYKIALAVKEYERAKEYLLKIRELEDRIWLDYDGKYKRIIFWKL